MYGAGNSKRVTMLLSSDLFFQLSLGHAHDGCPAGQKAGQDGTQVPTGRQAGRQAAGSRRQVARLGLNCLSSKLFFLGGGEERISLFQILIQLLLNEILVLH
jgi:hypothetical protein